MPKVIKKVVTCTFKDCKKKFEAEPSKSPVINCPHCGRNLVNLFKR